MNNQNANSFTDIDRREIDQFATELEGVIAAIERSIVDLDLMLSRATDSRDPLLRAQTSGSVMCAGSIVLFGVIRSLRDRFGTIQPAASEKNSSE
ncbi:hypothetical protein A9Q96_14955 [Rhodobacterales bacterium 52_120_T64]|nr:hypothetical protein A9Q96_14955 [Rhodobacterales bacterium 52_120_T64]